MTGRQGLMAKGNVRDRIAGGAKAYTPGAAGGC